MTDVVKIEDYNCQIKKSFSLSSIKQTNKIWLAKDKLLFKKQWKRMKNSRKFLAQIMISSFVSSHRDCVRPVLFKPFTIINFDFYYCRLKTII